jgi:periplasmic protein TonB
MISRLLVPPNARISSGESNETKVVHRDHLVPRRLISADARMSDAPSKAVGQACETAPTSRRLMVPKLLVPTGAHIDTPLMAASPVTASASANVLDDALLGDSFAGHRHTAAEWLISIGVHAAIVAAVLIVPLLYTQVIDLHQFEVTYLAAPLVPAPPPPPPPAAAVARQVPRKVLPATAKLTMPIAIPKTIPAPSAAPEAASDIVAGVAGGVMGGVPGGQVGGLLGGIAEGAGPAAPPPPPAPVAEALVPSGPLHVGGEVKPPRELYKTPPKYPLLAVQARIEGVVEIDALIDKDGNVVQARAVSGPGVLVPSALEAVKHWKYQPTYLNGVPWPIELTVHVTFSLS